MSLFMKIGNGFMKVVLHTPLHRLVSKNVMLITVTGRKSGHQYTTPVNYVQDDGALTTISTRERTWWRNLRGGAPVTLQLRGRTVQGHGDVLEADGDVIGALQRLLRLTPAYARYLDVNMAADGRPNADDLARAAQDRVIVKVHLN